MTNFQTLVKNSKLSLKEISEATGIGYSTLGNYNQGSRSPNAKNAQILSEYFGVSIPYLLGLDDNPVLKDPGSAKEIFKGFAKVLQGKSTIKSLNGRLLEMTLLLYLQNLIDQNPYLTTLIF